MENWFAVRVKPRHELSVKSLLCWKGYPVSLPSYRTPRVWARRKTTIELPVFPGYLFCRFDPFHRIPVVDTPGVWGVVGTRQAPTPVGEHEIEGIRLMERSGVSLTPEALPIAGQDITISTGPFSGLRGKLVAYKNRYRVIVTVTLLQRGVSVELDAKDVVPLANPAIMLRPADNCYLQQ